jgi:UDP-N-acetylmuramate dehydrogenase
VYEKQALVLVNRGGTTGIEVATLANTIVADVQKKFGVKITPEANII